MKDITNCKNESHGSSYFWRPGLDKGIERLAKQCPYCQEARNVPEKAACHWWQWPNSPWHRVHTDFAGPFLGTYFLVPIGAFSKWPEAIQMTSITT